VVFAKKQDILLIIVGNYTPQKKPVYKLLLDMNKEFKPSYYFNITKEKKEISNEYNNKRFLGVYDNKEYISEGSSRAGGVGKDGRVK